MSTYQEVAENLIHLYANYVEVCARNEEDYTDFSDDLVIAVEALLIRANEEKQKAMLRDYQSQLNSIAPIPQPSVNQWVEQGLNLSDYPTII
jgi:hypothetical protein